jgi:hypothetical protein
MTSPFVLCMAPVELPCMSLDRPDSFRRLVFMHVEKHYQNYSICNDIQHILHPPPWEVKSETEKNKEDPTSDALDLTI